MCGIFGYYSSGGTRYSDTELAAMGETIRHRGPDSQGIWHDVDHGVALGNQRLSILDLEHGDQPFISDDGRVVVVQNGEIFNHEEIAEDLKGSPWACRTHCDTEVILRLYEKAGIAGLDQLNGMFAIAIYDAKEEALFLFRDRVGEKPLYYHLDADGLVFGSEIKAILSLLPERPALDYTALNLFFGLNYVPQPYTLFEGVRHVKPGHYLRVDRSGIRENCWWDLSRIQLEEKSEAQWIDEFNSLLDDSVRIRLRADVPFGAFLSGGVDSSTVVGLMSRHMQQPVRTYSIGFDDPKYDESPYAQEAATRFQTQHTLEIVQPNLLSLWPMATYHCDQPHGDVSFLPTFKVAELAAQDVKMVLTGDGADELYAGYDKYKSFFGSGEDEYVCDDDFAQRYIANIRLFDDPSLTRLFAEGVRQQMSPEHSVSAVVRKELERSRHMGRINQALFVDTELLLSGNNLVKPDRMGMAVSIENRAPFLDYRLIEHAFSMPGELKLRQGETKYIYKKAVAGLIGDGLAYRKKQMFTVPVGDWFKKDLRPLCEDLLLSERTRARGLFDYDYVEKLLTDHCDERNNNTREIRALMAFEYWCREFMD
ncbi:asparagine synthase (glutamine-hydrolyzing) [Marinobacter confluentis]|uniref:asparagine synthase (glutamine-hydrolyzing) n=1 Tax=Marinobacter confluentis TaxID=1697557 RepID=A0A4Z1C1B9_9GAMM|nr:asparagine synthase (glutamine-hydrolyzing) [Marinobacter confluentis]TGN39921.1 asparagine synthase (glutamine-hydrolyzing) [Marinobacter confluentis]